MPIRDATVDDAGALAALSCQLGYSADADDIVRRLRDIEKHDAGAVMVAESVAGVIVGWTHVMPERAVVFDTRVQLAGLVVAENARSKGIGAALLRAAEDWARAHGFGELVVRSNVLRDRAHRFYLREGYAEHKRQAVFAKRL